MSGTAWSRPATDRELAVLRHPDQRTAWTILLDVTLAAGVDVDDEAVGALHGRHPIVGARLIDGERWTAGPPAPLRTAGEEALAVAAARFHLQSEPPVRLVVDPQARRLVIGAHHAALDGYGLVAVLADLLGAPPPFAPARPVAGGRRSGRRRLRRLVQPAPRLGGSWPAETLIGRELPAGARTSAIVAAAVSVVGPASVTIGVGGSAVVGNTASYRRLDLRPGDDVRAALAAALAEPEPAELGRVSRLPRPLLRLVDGRLGDTLLVSNLGLLDLPGVDRVAFHPAARGPSAVALGGAAISGGPSTLTLRARDLDPVAAATLMDRVVERLRPSGGAAAEW